MATLRSNPRKFRSPGNEQVAIKQANSTSLVDVNNTEAPSDDIHKSALSNANGQLSRGSLLKKVDDFLNNPEVMNLTLGPIPKLGRAKILLKRVTSFKEQLEPEVVKENNRSTTLNQMIRSVSHPVIQARETATLTQESGVPASDGTTLFLKPKKSPSNELEVIPVTNNKRTEKTITDNRVYLVNISAKPYITITLQGMPSEIECNPESTWSTIKSIGRNNPFYVYTGSEDSITFDITWYSDNGDDRESVINKCKLLESWTKSDGYKSSPPVVEIVWGKSEIFQGQTFILQSAKYKLANFQNSFRHSRKSKVIDGKLLPNSAIQSLVFKKITPDNTSTENIISKEKLSKTPGIKIS